MTFSAIHPWLVEGAFPVVLPVVVTTASLYVADVGFDEGMLVAGSMANAKFTRAPFLRFQKSLVNYDTRHPSDKTLRLDEWVKERERTVLVIESSHLVPFLADFRGFAVS